jgi:flagellar basal-body rod modification protein FlgD
MATLDDVVTQSEVGFDGNSYTTAVSNDKLTNDDFLKLMLEEMKQQDPTKPMDSKELMDSQLQMSSIEANQDMSNAMKALQISYENSALSSAANIIGHQVKDGTRNDKGEDKIYSVDTVKNENGTLYLNAKENIGVKDALKLVDGETETYIDYDTNGYILKADGTHVDGDIRVSLDAKGRFVYNDDKSLKLLNSDGSIVTDDEIKAKYKYATTFPVYAEEYTKIALSSVIEIK